MKAWKTRFYGSPAWKNLRETVKQRDHKLCVDCLKKGLITPAEDVHHIIPLTAKNVNNPAIALNPDNLVSLCRQCHNDRHEKHARLQGLSLIHI